MPNTDDSKKKHIFLFFRIAVISAVLIWAVSRLGQQQRWSSFLEYLRRMNIAVFALVTAVFMIGHVIVAFRWWLLLRTQAIRIRFGAAVRLFFLGWFYNNFMPSSVGGDIIRAWYVTRHTEKKFAAALSVFVDRAIGLLSTFAIAVFFYTIFLRGSGDLISFERPAGQTTLPYKWILIALIAVMVAAIGALALARKGRESLTKLSRAVWACCLELIKKFKDAVAIYCANPLPILAAFLLTVVMQMLVITGFWLLGRNMGIDAPARLYYVFFTLTWVIGAVPISIGGAGVIEGALVFLFVQVAGLDESAAWAIALSQRAVWMLTSLPGAVIHLIGAHLPKDIDLD
jgi:uncharacterized protein (TIRG00374 family)